MVSADLPGDDEDAEVGAAEMAAAAGAKAAESDSEEEGGLLYSNAVSTGEEEGSSAAVKSEHSDECRLVREAGIVGPTFIAAAA
eukprot:1157526-Pelagomonas_calceolata.AAC.11